MALIGDLLLRVGADLVSFNALKSNLDQAQEKIEAFSNNVSGVGAAIGDAFDVGLAGALLHFGELFDDATRTIIAKTGAMDDSLTSFQSSFSTVFASVDESAQEVAGTMGVLASRLDLVGPPLEELTHGVLDLAKVAQENVVPLAENISKAFATWQVATKDQTAAMDELMRVSQASGVRVTELVQQVQQFAPALRGLGLSFQDAVGLIGQFNKAGLEVGQAVSSIQKALVAMGKAGVTDPLEGLRSIAAAIKNATSEGHAFQIGAQAFGKGTTIMIDAIRSGKVDFDNFNGSLKLSTRTVAETAKEMQTIGDRLAEFWHQVEAAIAPAGQAFTKALEDMLDSAKPLVGFVGDMARAFGALPEPLQKAAIAFGAIALAVGPLMTAVKAISLVFTAFVSFLPSTGAAMTVLTEAVIGANTAWLVFQTTMSIEGWTGIFAAINAGFAELSLGLQLLAGGVVLAAGAFAGWKLGTWAHDNIGWVKSLGDTIGDFLLKIPGLSAALEAWGASSQKMAVPTKDLAASVKQVETELRAQGVVVEQGGRTLVQYASYLADVKKEMGGYTDEAAKAEAKARALKENLLAQALAAAEAAKKFGEWQTKLVEFVATMSTLPKSMQDFRDAALDGTIHVNGLLDEMSKKIKEGSANYAKMSAAGKAAFQELVSDFLKFKAEADQFNDEKILLSFRELDGAAARIFNGWQGPLREYVDGLRAAAVENGAALDQIEEHGKGVIGMLKSLVDAQKAAEASARELNHNLSEAVKTYSEVTNRAIKDNIKSFDELSAHGADLVTRLSPALFNILQQSKDSAEAMKHFGMTSTAVYDAILIKSQQYYNAILAKGADRREQLEAELGLLQAQINDELAHGRAVTDLRDRYNEVNHELDVMGAREKATIDYFKEFHQISSKAWSDFHTGITDAIVDGKSFGSVLTTVLKDIEKGFLDLALRAIGTDLKNALLGTAGQASELSKLFTKLGQVINETFGGGAKAASGIAGSSGSAGGAAAAVSSFSGVLGVLNVAVAALSGIVQGLQMAHLISTAGKIEENTRRLDLTTEGPDGLLDHIRQTHFGVSNLLADFDGWYQVAFASLMTTNESMLDELKRIAIMSQTGNQGDTTPSGDGTVKPTALGEFGDSMANLPVMLVKATNATTDAGNAFNDFSTAAADAVASADGLTQSTDDLSNAAITGSQATADLAHEILNLQMQMEALVQAGKVDSQEYEDAKSKLAGLLQGQSSLKAVGAQAEDTGASVGDLNTSLGDFNSSVKSVGSTVGSAATSIGESVAATKAALSDLGEATATTTQMSAAMASTLQEIAARGPAAFAAGDWEDGSRLPPGIRTAIDLTPRTPPAFSVGAGFAKGVGAYEGPNGNGGSPSVIITGNTILDPASALQILGPAIDRLRNAARLG